MIKSTTNGHHSANISAEHFRPLNRGLFVELKLLGMIIKYCDKTLANSTHSHTIDGEYSS
jgi:hypothetical protein